MRANKIWDRVKENIRPEMTDLSYQTYIKSLTPVMMQEDTLILEAPQALILDNVKEFYLKSIIDHAVKEGADTVVLILPQDRIHYRPDEEDKLISFQNLNPRYTFETFVVGSSNRFAHAAAKAVAQSPGHSYNPLFIYGGVGLGKTHLLHAIGNKIHERRPELQVVYVTSETFTNELITSIQENTNAQFRNKYRNVDLLMVDDVQFIAGKESTQEEFFHTFNTLYNANKQIVICSDRPPNEISRLEDRLRSRFMSGLLVDIQMPDLETRLAILQKRMSNEEIETEQGVLEFIAENVKSNVRELEGSLNRVLAYSKLHREQMNMQVATEALKDILPEIVPQMITIQSIQQNVAEYYNITVDAMLSKRRDREVVVARQVAMYFCRMLTDTSLPRIGDAFGGRDHTTVLHSCEKVTEQMDINKEFHSRMKDIEKRIKSPVS